MKGIDKSKFARRALALCLAGLCALLPAGALAQGGLIGGTAVEVIEQFAVAHTGTHTVTASALNVRSGPGTRYSVIGQLYRGAMVQVVALSGDFCQIISTDGRYGYVSRQYLNPMGSAYSTPVPTAAPTPRATARPTQAAQTALAVYRVTASALNVRTGPSTGYSVLTRVYSGDYVYKISDANYDWMQIRLQNGQYGYIMNKYAVYSHMAYSPAQPTAVPVPTAAPTQRPTATPRPAFTPQPTATAAPGSIYTTTANVNMRSGPATWYGVKTVLRYGTSVYFVARYSDEWYYVRTAEGLYGYVSARYLRLSWAPTPSPTPAPTVVNTGNALYSYQQMKADINSLYQRYPNMVTRVVSIGNTMWNQQIPAVCIGNPNAGKAILINAGIHGREYMSTLLVMKQMEHLLSSLESTYNGQRIRTMLDQCCIWFIPMINPDGVQISQTGLNGLNSTQKNNLIVMNGGSTYFARWKANGYGVDLNRNFDADWVRSGSPSPENYSGSYASSESETRAMTAFVKNHTNIRMSLNYHAVGNYIYWHYGQTGSQRTRDYAIAQRLRQITGYSLMDEDYSGIGGGFMDWMISTRGLPSFTIELGDANVAAPQTISHFANIWNANRDVAAAMLYYTLYELK